MQLVLLHYFHLEVGKLPFVHYRVKLLKELSVYHKQCRSKTKELT